MRTYSADEVGAYLASGYWSSTGKWTPPSYGVDITVNLKSLSDGNRDLAWLALEAWSALGFSFTETKSHSADWILQDNNKGAQTTWSPYSGQAIVNVGPDFTAEFGLDFGGYTYQSWLHEAGHALGLGHTGTYNAVRKMGADNLFSNDSWQMSVMSYFSQDDSAAINASYAYALTPMPGDLAAIDQLYDMKYVVGAGDTVYFWDTNDTGIYGYISQQIVSGKLTTPFTMTIRDDSGKDSLNFSGDSREVVLDLNPGSINSAFGLIGNLLIEMNTIIETVIGSGGNDTVSGQGVDNLLDGRVGDDWLDGRDGHDTLIGGEGADTLYGGAGNDVLNGGVGADQIDGGDGVDTLEYGDGETVLDLLVPDLNAGEALGDMISGIERIKTGRAADKVYGDDAGNVLISSGGNDLLDGRDGHDKINGGGGRDTLVGGAGNDTLHGGAGADLLDGGPGIDKVTYANVDSVIDLSDSSQNSGGARGDQLIGIEDVGAGDGDDEIYGNEVANRLIGNGGADLIEGRQGDDILKGYDGNDTLAGGEGNDKVSGGQGDDRIVTDAGKDLVTGGAGADMFVFRGGAVIITDFSGDEDSLLVEFPIPDLPEPQVSDLIDMAVIDDRGLILDFGGGNYIRCVGVNDPNVLQDDLIVA